METGKTFSKEHVHYSPDNTKVYDEISAVSLKNGKGDITYLVLVMKDITKQREYEKKLQLNQE